LSGISNVKEINHVKDLDSLVKPKGHAKADWVLRWLVEKLKSQEAGVGSAFRASPLSWKLLLALTKILPESNVARQLSSGKVLASVTNSLDEWLKDWPSNIANGTQRQTDRFRTYLNHGVKRKRGDFEGEGSDIATPPVHNQLVYDHISTFLEYLLARIDRPQDVDSISREHLKASLRVKPELAAELLSSWMRICRIQLTCGTASHDFSLNPYKKFWELRSIDHEEEDSSSAEAFAEDCIVPAALLYSTIVSSSALQNDATQILKREVEALLSQHLILPARASYFSVKQQRSASLALMTTRLIKLLSPLEGAISFCRNAEDDAQLETLLSVIPSLFELAIHYTPRLNAKQRSVEAPWLEALLCALSAAAGAIISREIGTQTFVDNIGPPETALPPLEAMLRISKPHNIGFSSELLRHIVSELGGLRISTLGGLGKGITIHWPLITAVMDLDGSTFVPQEQQMSKTNPNRTEASVINLLINQISKMSWDESLKTPSQDQSPIDWTRDQFISEMVVRLIGAFISFRKLSDFIDMWVFELIKVFESMPEPDRGNTVWTSKLLIENARSSWEAALTSSQLQQLLNDYYELFKASTDNVSLEDLKSSAEMSASLVILEALLAAMNHDETLNMSKSSIRLLAPAIESILASGIEGLRSEARLWRILTRVIQLQTHLEDSQYIIDRGEKIMRSKVMSSALTTIENVDSASVHEAIVFILTVVDVLLGCGEKAIWVDPLSQRTTEALTSRILKEPTKYLTVLVRFRFTLCSMARDPRIQIFKTALSCQQAIKKYDQIEALQETIISLNNRDILMEWITSMLDLIGEDSTTAAAVLESHIGLILMKLPVRILSKQEKTTLTDILIDLAIRIPGRTPEDELLAFLVKMIRVSPRSKIFSDPQKMVELVTKWNYDELSHFASHCIIKIVQSVFSHLGQSSKQSHNTHYFATLDSILKNILATEQTKEHASQVYVPLFVYRLRLEPQLETSSNPYYQEILRFLIRFEDSGYRRTLEMPFVSLASPYFDEKEKSDSSVDESNIVTKLSQFSKTIQAIEAVESSDTEVETLAAIFASMQAWIKSMGKEHPLLKDRGFSTEKEEAQKRDMAYMLSRTMFIEELQRKCVTNIHQRH
jgi:hypothetical protein